MYYQSHPNATVREGIGRHPNSYFDSSIYMRQYYQSQQAITGNMKENKVSAEQNGKQVNGGDGSKKGNGVNEAVHANPSINNLS